jgi:hypothetical protein
MLGDDLYCPTIRHPTLEKSVRARVTQAGMVIEVQAMLAIPHVIFHA